MHGRFDPAPHVEPLGEPGEAQHLEVLGPESTAQCIQRAFPRNSALELQEIEGGAVGRRHLDPHTVDVVGHHAVAAIVSRRFLRSEYTQLKVEYRGAPLYDDAAIRAAPCGQTP